ncbi:MAG: mechanosensitive ion channel domain-containing protein [Geobacteraceae bacterium]
METFWNVLEKVKSFLSFSLFKMGHIELTFWTLIYLVVLIYLLFYLSEKLKILVADKILARRNIDIGVRQAMATILRYVIIAIGFIIILQTAGIDLTALNVLAGAVGIGVGFGLQNIASNFISGLIILFERPIKIGDRIEVGNVEGDVVQIKGRSTTVVTNDNIAIIVPNSNFITQNVVNWSLHGKSVRFKVPVGVSYKSDVRLVEKLLLEAADENPDVLKAPPPAVRFMEFGDSALLFELRVWSTSLVQKKGLLISSLNFSIIEKFRENGIEIPFPQRDLYLRSGPIEVKTVRVEPGQPEDD